MNEPPELWWSPSLAAGGLVGDAGEWPDEHGTEAESGLIEVENGVPYVQRFAMPWWELPELPADAVPLGVVEDPKHRGPAYERGFADGRLASLAGTADLTPILRARTGMAEPVAELEGIASDSEHDVDRVRLLRIAAAIRGEPAGITDPDVPEENHDG